MEAASAGSRGPEGLHQLRQGADGQANFCPGALQGVPCQLDASGDNVCDGIVGKVRDRLPVCGKGVGHDVRRTGVVIVAAELLHQVRVTQIEDPDRVVLFDAMGSCFGIQAGADCAVQQGDFSLHKLISCLYFLGGPRQGRLRYVLPIKIIVFKRMKSKWESFTKNTVIR